MLCMHVCLYVCVHICMYECMYIKLSCLHCICVVFSRDYLDRAITAYCHNRDPSNSVAKTATIFASQMLGQWFTSRQ